MGNEDLAVIGAELKRAKRPLLAGHVLPDGDSLGSMLALRLLLEQLGAQVNMVSQDQVPAVYRFLPGVELIRVGELPPGPFDYLVILDCSVPERLGQAVQQVLLQEGLRVINIDHHVSAEAFADFNYIDPGAAAVGEIIFDLAGLMGTEITTDIATCLYTAIATDTGSFRYENTGPDTHRRVARLIETGLDVGALNTLIYDEKPLTSVRLLHRVLGTLRVGDCGRFAWMQLTRAMERECGVDQSEVEDLINYARAIQGVEVGLLFREMPDGRIKVGFRSKRRVDVSRLAAVFGGGGHPRAAGCMFEGTDLAAVEAQVIGVVQKTIAEALDGRDS